MKTLTATAAALLAQPTGIDPSVIVRIDWPTTNPSSPLLPTPEYYGDKSQTIGSTQVQGWISALSPISSGVGPEYSAALAIASLTLIDPGGLLYLRLALLNSAALETTPVKVYLHVEGMAQGDWVVLLEGKIGGAVRYSERDVTLSLDILSPVRSTPVTYTLDQDLDDDVPDESDGAVVPIAFGVPRDVPAVLFRRGPRTRITNDIDSSDTKWDLEDSSEFDGTGITKFRVEDEIVTGSVGNDEFTATGRNVNAHSNLVTAQRPSQDPDVGNPFVFFCDDETKIHVGMHVIFSGSVVPGTNSTRRIGLCVAQKGNKLTFHRPWTKTTGGSWMIGAGLTYDVKRYAFDWVDDFNVNANAWTIQAGALVTGFEQDFATYLASAVSATNVLRVRAWRTYQQGRLGLNERRLVSVPASYYTATNVLVDLADGSGSLVPVTCCKIHFLTSLASMNQGWEDGTVYVTLRSSVGSNVADQIAWLLTNRTNVTADATTFSSTSSAIAKYRADYAILDDVDAIAACHDIAYQARCGLAIFGSTAKLRYLSAAPTLTGSTFTIRNRNVREDGFALRHSPFEDVATVLRATWRRGYTGGDDERRKRGRAKVAEFGVRTRSRDFWIYQRKSLVSKSVSFWKKRHSRPWKLVELDADLFAVALEPLIDDVALALSDVLITDPTISFPWSIDYDSTTHTVKLLLWLPFESGQNYTSPDAFLIDTGDPTLSDPAPKAGKKVIARTAPFAFTMASEPLQQAVPAKILKVISGTTAEMEIFPSGFAGPSSGVVFVSAIHTPQAGSWVVGKTGLVWQLPSGDYVTDVFAQ